NLCYEIHPSEDLHDGVTFERFHALVDHHARCKILFDPSHFVMQQLDYLAYIDIYREHIRMFHVKDAEFQPSGRQGVYGGYSSWLDRAGRFRSLGDGQVDFKAIFSKLAQYDYPGWAVLEWECCLKNQEDGAREGVAFINDHMIRVTERAFDDFAGAAVDARQIHTMLGIA
ncbi:MAG: TIM barrel protein, partial [Burkholderia sp.]